jgi:hypothetical protein
LSVGECPIAAAALFFSLDSGHPGRNNRLFKKGAAMHKGTFIAFTTAGMMLVAGAAVAQTSSASLPTEKATVTANALADKPVCEHSDAPTGSRFGARSICHTAAQWRTIHDNAEQNMRYMQESHDNGVEGAALAAGQ